MAKTTVKEAAATRQQALDKASADYKDRVEKINKRFVATVQTTAKDTPMSVIAADLGWSRQNLYRLINGQA